MKDSDQTYTPSEILKNPYAFFSAHYIILHALQHVQGVKWCYILTDLKITEPCEIYIFYSIGIW